MECQNPLKKQAQQITRRGSSKFISKWWACLISDAKEYLDSGRNEPLFEGSSKISLLKRSPNEGIDNEAKKCKCNAFHDLVLFLHFKKRENTHEGKVAGFTLELKIWNHFFHLASYKLQTFYTLAEPWCILTQLNSQMLTGCYRLSCLNTVT